MAETTETNNPVQGDEILMDLLIKAWKGRKAILICTGIFLVIGIFLALISPKEYQSQVTVLVEPGGSNPAANSAILKQLSALTGVPTGGSQDALTPALYPLVVGSMYFRLDMISKQVTDSKTGKQMTLLQYLDENPPTTLSDIVKGYTIGLPGTIIRAIRGKQKTDTATSSLSHRLPPSILPPPSSIPGIRLSVMGPSDDPDSSQMELTPDEKSKIGMLASRINAEIKKGSGNLLVITVRMEDPGVAKELAGSVVTSLSRFIIEYRTRKVKNDRKFIEGLHAEAEKKYKRAQQTLAAYRDRNQDVIRSAARTEGESLQAEYTLALNVYTGLSQLLEQAKINVQENTPVFTMIEPPSDAYQISSGRKLIMIMVFLGLLTGLGIVFGRPYYERFREKLFSP